jgi:O-antigen/teichoic acid export membrane protein
MGASFVIVMGLGAARIIGYLFYVVVARLGPETFGVFSLCVAVVIFASQLAGLGMPAGVVRYVPFYYGRGDEARLRGLLLLALGVSGGMALLLGGGLYAGAPYLSQAIWRNPAMSWGLQIMAVAVLLLALKQVLVKAFVALHRYQYRIVFFQLMENALKVGFVVAFIAIGWGLAGILTAYVLALMASVIFAFFFLERRIFGVLKNAVAPIVEAKELFVFSLPLYFSGLLTLGGNWLDILVLGALRSASEVGVYSVGVLFAAVLAITPELFLPVSFPHIINSYARDEAEEARRLARQVSNWLTISLVFVTLWLVLVGRDLLLLFFGKSYEGGWLVVQLLLVGSFLAAISQPSSRVLSMVKRTKLILVINLVAFIFAVGGYALLIPRYGIYGAAASTTISLAVRSILFDVGATRTFHFSVFALGGPFGKVAAVGAIAALAAHVAGRALSGVAAFALVTTVLAALYLLGLVVLRVVSVKEWKLFRELLPFSSPSAVEEVPL